MSKKNKLARGILFGAATASAISAINKLIFTKSTANNILPAAENTFYSWRFGNIFYKKTGSGKPLLLIHDLVTASSGFEWNQIADSLSENHTVYILDLLGCGRSQKPNLTYTNFLYVQLLTDFIKSVIGHRTDVIATGSSCPFIITTCANNPELFDKIIMINPDAPIKCNQTPNKYVKIYKFLIDFPVIGTLIYNIANSRRSITEKFLTDNFANPCLIDPDLVSVYHESSHLGGSAAKALYSSIKANYTRLNINHALKNIDNSIFIIGGEYEKQIEETISEYTSWNPAIEAELLEKTAHLPQLEQPEPTLKLICDILDV